jgi:hypothetical protein
MEFGKNETERARKGKRKERARKGMGLRGHGKERD